MGIADDCNSRIYSGVCRGAEILDWIGVEVMSEDELVVLRECMDIVVERPTVNKGGWEIP